MDFGTVVRTSHVCQCYFVCVICLRHEWRKIQVLLPFVCQFVSTITHKLAYERIFEMFGGIGTVHYIDHRIFWKVRVSR